MEFVLLALAAAVLIYMWWRSTREDTETFERDRPVLPMLAPLAIELAGHRDVSPAAVAELAAVAHARPVLYEMLHFYGHTELFPESLQSIAAQAEGILAHGVMHPSELGAPPVSIERVTSITRELDGRAAEFRILRYRMPDGHPSSGNGWMIAAVGPFLPGSTPYLNDARVMTATTTATASDHNALVDVLIRERLAPAD